MKNRIRYPDFLSQNSSSKASAQLKLILSLAVFSIALAFLIGGIHAEHFDRQDGMNSEDRMIRTHADNKQTFESAMIQSSDSGAIKTLSSSALAVALMSPNESGEVIQNYFFDFTVNVTCTGAYCGDVEAALDPVSYDCNGGCVGIEVNDNVEYFDSEPRDASVTYQDARDACIEIGGDLTNFDESYAWVYWYEEDSFDIPYYSYADSDFCSDNPAEDESTCCGMIGDGFGYHDLYGCSCHDCYYSDDDIPSYGYICVFRDKGVIPMDSGSPFYTTTQNPMTSEDTACLGDMDDGDSCNITWAVNATGSHLSSYKFYVIFNSTEYPDQEDSDDIFLTINDTDFDDDGINNSDDNCINTSNHYQNDSDDDGVGDACDNCVDLSNSGQDDSDSDDIGDDCDLCPDDADNDIDNDSICAGSEYNEPMTGDLDNCITTYNPEQNDSDDDSIGDICDFCDTYTTENITLENDWVCGSDNDYGIYAGSDNITIDCNGYAIYGHDSGVGIYIEGYNNITIKNCSLVSFDNGITVYESNDTNITDNSAIDSNDYGVYISDCNNLLIDSNYVNNSYYSGVYIEGESGSHYTGSTITNNNVTFAASSCGSGCGGIELIYEDNNLIQGNTVSDSNYNGISLFGCRENDILDNTIERSENYGIRIAARNEGVGANNTLDGNTFLNNSYAIRIATEDNTITSNIISGNNRSDDTGVYIYSDYIDPARNYFARNNVSGFYYGIEIYEATNSSFVDNNVFGNSGDGFYIEESENALIHGGRVYNNNYDWDDYGGIYVYDSFNFMLEDAYLFNNTDIGLYINYADNFTIEDSDILNSTDYGIYMYESYNGVLRDNNILGSVNNVGFYAENSIATVYNSNFENNANGYSIYDEVGGNISWVIDNAATCRNNDVKIWGTLSIVGAGILTAENCTITVQGVVFSTGSAETPSNPAVSGISESSLPLQGQDITINISEIQSSTHTLAVGDTVRFTVNNEAHTGKIMSLGPDHVVLWLYSDKVSVTVMTGETKQVDLNNDSIADVSVYLAAIEYGKATLAFNSLVQPVAAAAQAAAPAEITAPSEQAIHAPAAPVSLSSGWITVAIVVVVIGAAGIAWWAIKKR